MGGGGERGGGGEGSPGEILKTKTAGEAISDHFAMRIKVSNLPELCLQCICRCFGGESPHLFHAFKCLRGRAR